jgi:hypothetical protein
MQAGGERIFMPPLLKLLGSTLIKDNPRAGAVPALQGLLVGSRVSLQAEPPRDAAADEDRGEQPAVDMVAR